MPVRNIISFDVARCAKFVRLQSIETGLKQEESIFLENYFRRIFKEVQICRNIFRPSPQMPRKFVKFLKFCDPQSCSTHDVYKHGADSMASSTVQFFKIKAELPTILPTLATHQTNGCTTSAREYLCDQDISSADTFRARLYPN